jgi:hypothetical protein
MIIEGMEPAVKRSRNRRPYGYDGSGKTSWLAAELAGSLMQEITQVIGERPDLILAAWPEIIGSQLATMTEAISFLNGVLTVKVKNSTLLSLLNQREKSRVISLLRERFPKVTFANIIFRMG